MSKTKRNITGIAVIAILSGIAAYSAKRVASKRKAEKARLDAIRPITGTQSPNPRLGARVPFEMPPVGYASPVSSSSTYSFRKAMLLPLGKKIELLSVLNPAMAHARLGGVLFDRPLDEHQVQQQLDQLMMSYARLHGAEALGRVVNGFFDQHMAQECRDAEALWRSVNSPLGH